MSKKALLRDISKLAGDEQTWNLEAFHTLLNQFQVKMFSFIPIIMECRVKLAAIHYNENAGTKQMHTHSGEPIFQKIYPKYKKGGYFVRKVLKNQTFDYIDKHWTQVQKECQKLSEGRRQVVSWSTLPPNQCANFEHPDKENDIEEHASRYKHKK